MAREWLASRRWPQLTGGDDAAFVRAGRACLVRGGHGSARRDALVEQVEKTVEAGAPADDVLVVCADPSAASRVRARLRASGVAGVADVRVVTGRELACDVLEAAAGKAPRVLAAYEADFVVEDVKTLGARPKRLRELLKFLYRGWTELLDEDPTWLFTVEEISTLEFLTEELAYLGAVMEPQISNLATKALRLDSALLGRCKMPHLFVLDYQNLSRASQLLCQLVAGDDLVAVAGDTCTETYESYPYVAGVEDFGRLNPQVDVVDLGSAADEAERSLRVYETPQEEITAVADAVASLVEGDADPSDVAVMTLHPWWTRSVARALEERGVVVNPWLGALKLRGDIRELDACLALRMVTLLRLLADPEDGVAWRSWFGFGDYLTRSNQFAEMRKACGSEEAAYPGDVLRDLEAFGFDMRYDLDPLFARVRDLRGSELLECLVQTLAGDGVAVPGVLRPLLALGSDADAARMVAELDRLQFFCGVADCPGVVVASSAAMANLDFDQAFIVGCVNGLFPSADFFDLTKVSVSKQEKMRAHDERVAHTMAGVGRHGVHVSCFERVDRPFAERVHLKQARIFAANDEGAQMSEVEPSIYVDVLVGEDRHES